MPLRSLILLLVIGCNNQTTDPILLDSELGPLLAAPETLQVNGHQLTLSTYLWRDFMPISPPDGQPLIAIIFINSINTDSITIPLDADTVWVIHQDSVWKSAFTGESEPGLQKPNQLFRIARDGPKWGPGIFVEVVVRILGPQNSTHFLRASKQYIGMTV